MDNRFEEDKIFSLGKWEYDVEFRKDEARPCLAWEIQPQHRSSKVTLLLALYKNKRKRGPSSDDKPILS